MYLGFLLDLNFDSGFWSYFFPLKNQMSFFGIVAGKFDGILSRECVVRIGTVFLTMMNQDVWDWRSGCMACVFSVIGSGFDS